MPTADRLRLLNLRILAAPLAGKEWLRWVHEDGHDMLVDCNPEGRSFPSVAPWGWWRCNGDGTVDRLSSRIVNRLPAQWYRQEANVIEAGRRAAVSGGMDDYRAQEVAARHLAEIRVQHERIFGWRP